MTIVGAPQHEGSGKEELAHSQENKRQKQEHKRQKLSDKVKGFVCQKCFGTRKSFTDIQGVNIIYETIPMFVFIWGKWRDKFSLLTFAVLNLWVGSALVRNHLLSNKESKVPKFFYSIVS